MAAVGRSPSTPDAQRVLAAWDAAVAAAAEEAADALCAHIAAGGHNAEKAMFTLVLLPCPRKPRPRDGDGDPAHRAVARAVVAPARAAVFLGTLVAILRGRPP